MGCTHPLFESAIRVPLVEHRCSNNRTKSAFGTVFYGKRSMKKPKKELQNKRLIAAIVVVALAITLSIFAYVQYLHIQQGDPKDSTSNIINSTVINGENNAAVTPQPTDPSTSTPTATPNSKLTVTYSELSRNETLIAIQFKLEPNSYVFQLNATSFYLTENAKRISANTNDVIIIGTQYSTVYFPISDYNGTDYHLSSDVLPSDTIWVRQ